MLNYRNSSTLASRSTTSTAKLRNCVRHKALSTSRTIALCNIGHGGDKQSAARILAFAYRHFPHALGDVLGIVTDAFD